MLSDAKNHGELPHAVFLFASLLCPSRICSFDDVVMVLQTLKTGNEAADPDVSTTVR